MNTSANTSMTGGLDLPTQIFVGKKVIVCVGTGGVGKTTISAAIGVQAAMAGQRVLVLTVDPAQRLATSLGIDPHLMQAVRVPGQTYSGELSAAVVHPQKVFDDFVSRFSTPEKAERLKKNLLYRQLTTRISGSQEFTSLELLLQSHESGLYDLIVLDTPPAQHAMDFLQAPLKLYALFQSSVTQWFLQAPNDSGWWRQLLASGRDRALEALRQLTGASFIQELQDFFALAQSWQSSLSERMMKVHNLLTGAETSFLLVTSFDEAKLDEAFELQRELKRQGYGWQGLIINRAFPTWALRGTCEAAAYQGPVHELILFWQQLQNFYETRKNMIKTMMKEQMRGSSTHMMFFQVPDFAQEICDLPGVERVATSFRSEGL